MTIALFAMALTLGAEPPAQAETERRPNTFVMDEELRLYFGKEKAAGLAFGGVGAGSLVAGGLALASGSATLQGAAVPLLGLGLAQAAVGLVLLLRTDRQIADLSTLLFGSRGEFAAQEGTRMVGVQSTFRILVLTEAALFVAGVILAGVGAVARSAFVGGLGVGLAAETACLFTLDVAAARRGDAYLTTVLNFARL